MPSRLARPSLLARFSVLSLTAVVVIGVVLTHILERQVEHRARDAAEQTARAVALTGVADRLRAQDWRGHPLAPRRLRDLARALAPSGSRRSASRG